MDVSSSRPLRGKFHSAKLEKICHIAGAPRGSLLLNVNMYT
jgi:hypothetical protein